MIEDPDDADYRYPMAGERLWHRWGCWVVVAEDQDPSDEIVGAVRVTVDSEGGVEGGGRPLEVGRVSVVKLKSLTDSKHMAHVLDSDGVTDAPFVRTRTGYTNATPITIKWGSMLDFGNGMTLGNGGTLDFTFTTSLTDPKDEA